MTRHTVAGHRPREHARYGAASQQEAEGPLPQPFPRQIGARAMEYPPGGRRLRSHQRHGDPFRAGLRRGPRRRLLHRHAGMHAGPGGARSGLRLRAGRRDRGQLGERLRHGAGSDQRRLHPRLRRHRARHRDRRRGDRGGLHLRAHPGDPGRAPDGADLRHGRHQRGRGGPRAGRVRGRMPGRLRPLQGPLGRDPGRGGRLLLRLGEDHGFRRGRLHPHRRRPAGRARPLRRPEPRRRDGGALRARAHGERLRPPNDPVHGRHQPRPTGGHLSAGRAPGP